MIEMRIYSVAEVSLLLNEALGAHPVLSDLWLAGEISNYTRASSGHQYFTIKDSLAQVRCVLFRSSDYGISLQNGLSVVAHGRFSIYEARGDLQFYVDLVQPEGVGVLQLEFERLKAQLMEEGLFDQARKRPLPLFPKRVALVTSPTGAVLHDIINVTSRRYPMVELVVVPTQVQGDGAALQICGALREVNSLESIDVVILARGGGSLEELWPFNEEMVARAIFASRAPVVSAIGHETDVTIADLVADLRAPTPSAAAELVFPNWVQLKSRLLSMQAALKESMDRTVLSGRYQTENCAAHLRRSAPNVDSRRQRVDDLTRVLSLNVSNLLTQSRGGLAQKVGRLGALNPAATLGRGYAIVQHGASGRVVSKKGHVGPGDPINVNVSDGSFAGVVGGPTVSRNGSRKGKQRKEQLPLFEVKEAEALRNDG